MQIADNDYVTFTPFSKSFEYIFSILDSEHTSSSAYWISPPPPLPPPLPAADPPPHAPLAQLPAYI